MANSQILSHPLNEAIHRSIEHIDELVQELTSLKTQISTQFNTLDHDQITRVCPLCSGTMRDLSKILVMARQTQEVVHRLPEVFYDIENILATYNHPYPPLKFWECTDCGGVTTQNPSRQSGLTIWSKGEASATSFAGIVFSQRAEVLEVAYDSTSSEWYIRVGSEWFYYKGLKGEILDRLKIEN